MMKVDKILLNNHLILALLTLRVADVTYLNMNELQHNWVGFKMVIWCGF